MHFKRGIEGLSEDLFAFCVGLPSFVKGTVFDSAAVPYRFIFQKNSRPLQCHAKKDGCIRLVIATVTVIKGL